MGGKAILGKLLKLLDNFTFPDKIVTMMRTQVVSRSYNPWHKATRPATTLDIFGILAESEQPQRAPEGRGG